MTTDGSAQRRPNRARVYAALRSAHLERFTNMVPAVVLYQRGRYDLDEQLLREAGHLHCVTRVGAMVHLVRHGYVTVELNEPLMLSRWLDLGLQLLVVKGRALVTGRQTIVAAYCIGNADPAEELAQRWRLPLPLARAVTTAVLGVLVRGYDRLAFGTDASREIVESYVGRRTLDRRARTYPALPAQCDTCGEALVRRSPGHAILFLGAFSERKGVRQLLEAWDLVDIGASPGLRIVGQGPLSAVVESWAAGRPDVAVEVDPPRGRIHASLQEADVVVLLSQRVGTWREQVGLPVVEALAHGCEVVTTSETGIAGWLEDHGHTVLDPDAPSDVVMRAILDAAERRRPRASILGDLPTRDARLAADSWMVQ